MANKTTFETINIDDFIHEPINQERVQSYPPELVGRFNSFIVTAFDDSMTVEMQIRTLIKWIKENIDVTMSALDNMEAFKQDAMAFQNHVKDTLVNLINNFTDAFDDNLKAETLEILTNWFDDGLLSDIVRIAINEEVINARGDKETLGQRLDDSDEEIINARGGRDTLSQRLDDNDAKLAERATIIKPTGTNNDSPNINTLIGNGGEFIIKSGVYNIDEDIDVKSNTKITFEKNVIFQKTTTDTDHYNIINLFEVENVEINSPYIIGDRNTHTGTTGEWGHGLSVVGCKNVYVNNPVIKDCWGDGIYLGKDFFKNDNHNENVVIYEPHIENCRRNGISACNGQGIGLTIVRPYIKDINGTNPQAGIDIEAEGINARLDNLNIIDPVTENCAGRGIDILLGNIADKGLSCYISIQNHKDVGSNTGLGAWGSDGILLGEINVINPYWENNKINACSFIDYGINLPTINIIKPHILNNNTSNRNDYYGASISIFRESTSTKMYETGNIRIINPIIRDTREPKLIKYAFYIADMKNSTFESVKNVDIIDPLKLSVNTMVYRAMGSITDQHNQMKINNTYYDMTIYPFWFYKFIDNKGAADWITYKLTDIPEGVTSITFKISTQKVIIKPPAGGRIRPIGTTDQKIESSTIGSQITLKPMGNNEWHVENIVGSWTAV